MSSKNLVKKEHDNGQRSVVLDKIHGLIDRADPDTWRHGGEPLDPAVHYLKPRRTWEEVYTQVIDSGTLVFRKCTPITAEFKGRGYSFSPVAGPKFTVELRASGWHHSELTDPDRRSQHADRTCHVLAEGSIAGELFSHVQEVFAAYHSSRQIAFEKEALKIVESLPEKLDEQSLDTFERFEDTPGDIHYRNTIEGLALDIYRTYQNDKEIYGIKVSRRHDTCQIKNIDLCKKVYAAVEDLGQTSRLMTLSRALEAL